MKNFFALTAVTLCATLAFAQSTTNWVLSSNGENVKKAVTDVVNWSTVKCAGTVTREGATKNVDFSAQVVQSYVTNSDAVYTSQGGTQPLVKFSRTVNGTSVNIYVTTTADHKSVSEVKIHYRTTEAKSVNIGTIDQPVMQQQSVVIEEDIGTCK